MDTKASPQQKTTFTSKKCFGGEANDQFIVKVADSMDEAVKLMEVGFEYHTEVEDHKLFRKRK